MTRRRMVANGVDRLSSKSVVDCHGILGDYLRSIGKRGTIGDTPVYVVRRSNGINNYLMAENFELSEELEEVRELGRASIHKATWKVRMTDEELEKEFRRATMSHGTGPLFGTHWEFIKDLRDRYEEIGKYAPKQPASAPPVNNGELVKP